MVRTKANARFSPIDILADDETTGEKIIIGNQLEPTNHDILGKIIAYASGFDKKTIIWIEKKLEMSINNQLID